MSEIEMPKRLSISEETLRLQLAELELRLRIFFSEQLEKKASRDELIKLREEFDSLNRGDFTPAHKRALINLVDVEMDVSTSQTWTKRERLVMVLGILLTAMMLLLNVYIVSSANSAGSGVSPNVSSK